MMSEENIVKRKRKLAIKIIIPVLFLCVIAGIWAVKNYPKSSPKVVSSTVVGNPDFALTVTKKVDLNTLKSYGLPILIEFGSDSCAPCQQMAPIIEELNRELQGKAIIIFVDVWKYPDFADGYPLTVIPTQLFIDAKGQPYNPNDPKTLSMKLYSAKDTSEHLFTTHEGTMTKSQLLTVLKEMGMK